MCSYHLTFHTNVSKCCDDDILESRVVQKPWVPKKELPKDLDELIKEPAKPAPQKAPRPEETLGISHSDYHGPQLISYSAEYHPNILLNSVRSIEAEMWRRETEGYFQPGIVTLALEYIYDEVYGSS